MFNRTRLKRETLHQNMTSTFNLLTDTLTLERHLALTYSRTQAEDTLRQWRLCRRTLRHLGEDYAIAVARYRRAVRASFGVTARPRL